MKNSYYYNSNLSTEELKENFYNNILNASLEGNKDLVTETLNLAKYNSIALDLSYQDGLLPVLAAQRNDYEILSIFFEYDKNLIQKYGVEILSHAASYGQIDCVNFLLQQGISPLELKNTTAYNNYHTIEEMFISYENEHQNTINSIGEHNESDH